jgi:predicted PurR-regulated permease PerM
MFRERKNFVYTVLIVCICLLGTLLIWSKIDQIFGVLGKLLRVLTPFFIGFAIAYILNPIVEYIHKKAKIRRGYIIAVVYITLIIIIALFISLILPKLAESLSQLFIDIPKYLSQFHDRIFADTSGNQLIAYVKDILTSLQEKLSEYTNIIILNFTGFLIGTTYAVMNIVFGLIISVYTLIDKNKLKGLGKKLLETFLSEKKSEKALKFIHAVNVIFSRFMTGLIVEAIAVGILAFIAMTILKVKYALIFAIIICFTNVIPYIGPFIGMIPAVTITLFYDPWKAFWVFTAIVCIQQFDGNFMGPKIMGSYIGLRPLWIILAITIGGGFAGPLGMILSIPIAAVLKIVFSEIIEKRERKNEAKLEAEK